MRDKFSAYLSFNVPEEYRDGLTDYIHSFPSPVQGPEIHSFSNITSYDIDMQSIMDYWNFNNELKTSPYYEYWEEYENEEYFKEIQRAIVDDTIEWDYQILKRLLSDPEGWWGTKGDITSWYSLVALLNKRFITVSVNPCPIYPVPEKMSIIITVA